MVQLPSLCVILMMPPPDDGFTEMQQRFMEKHYHHFEDKEENKFIYTDIFREYVSNNALIHTTKRDFLGGMPVSLQACMVAVH